MAAVLRAQGLTDLKRSFGVAVNRFQLQISTRRTHDATLNNPVLDALSFGTRQARNWDQD